MYSNFCSGSPLSCAHTNTDSTVVNDCISTGVGSMCTILSKSRAVLFLSQNSNNRNCTRDLDPPTHQKQCKFVRLTPLRSVRHVNGNPSGSRSEIRSKRPLWRSGSSSAVNLLTDRTLWTSLCSIAQITVIAFQRHPGFRNSSILFLGNSRGLKIRLLFGNEWRHHCLHYGHGLNATSFIHVNSVPFLNVWNRRFPMMRSSAVTKKLTPLEQINLLRGSI